MKATYQQDDEDLEAAAIAFVEAKKKYEEAKKRLHALSSKSNGSSAVGGRSKTEDAGMFEFPPISSSGPTETVSNYLRSRAGESVELSKMINETGLKSNTVRSILSNLKKSGKATPPKRGKWKWIGG